LEKPNQMPYTFLFCKEFAMSEATVTSKGQVTIPADIRRSLGLEAQDRLSFTPMPDGTVVMRAKTQSVVALKGLLKPKSGQRVAIKDMNLGAD
jgi:antitoxin PrlF